MYTPTVHPHKATPYITGRYNQFDTAPWNYGGNVLTLGNNLLKKYMRMRKEAHIPNETPQM